jgi:hypothetical protein
MFCRKKFYFAKCGITKQENDQVMDADIFSKPIISIGDCPDNVHSLVGAGRIRLLHIIDFELMFRHSNSRSAFYRR